MNNLPQDIINLIYEYDNTKYVNMKPVFEELHRKFIRYYTYDQVYEMVYEWLISDNEDETETIALIDEEGVERYLDEMFYDWGMIDDELYYLNGHL